MPSQHFVAKLQNSLLSFRHVCDGKWECPDGDDENNEFCQMENRCSGMFKCRHEKTCLHFAEICDGTSSCSAGEDEILCDMEKCHFLCKCFLYAMQCQHVTRTFLDDFELATHRVYVELVNFIIVQQRLHKIMTPNIEFFKWKESNLTDVGFVASKNLQLLDLSKNMIQVLSSNCFNNSLALKLLLLGRNKISKIDPAFLGKNVKLLHLDLSHNHLTEFLERNFKAVDILLQIVSNKFVSGSKSIHNLKVKEISTDDYRICCVAKTKGIECQSRPEWPNTCDEDILSTSLKIVAGTMMSLVQILNIVALCLATNEYLTSKRPQSTIVNGVKIVQKSVISSSYMLGLILLFFHQNMFAVHVAYIFSVNLYFSNSLVWSREHFLSSLHCKVVGCFTILFWSNSIFHNNFLSISRLIVTKFPFNTFCKQDKNVVKCAVIATVGNCSFSLALYFSFFFAEHMFSVPSLTCFLLGKTAESVTMISATCVACVLQVGSVILVAVCYWVINVELSATTVGQESNLKKEKRNNGQAVVLILSCAACFLPSTGVYVVSLVSQEFPISLLLWNVVLLIHINSLITPVVYCLFPQVKKCISAGKS